MEVFIIMDALAIISVIFLLVMTFIIQRARHPLDPVDATAADDNDNGLELLEVLEATGPIEPIEDDDQYGPNDEEEFMEDLMNLYYDEMDLEAREILNPLFWPEWDDR